MFHAADEVPGLAARPLRLSCDAQHMWAGGEVEEGMKKDLDKVVGSWTVLLGEKGNEAVGSEVEQQL